jgi:hypothetical protein
MSVGQPFDAEREHALRRRRGANSAARGLVDADVGGLRRQQHRGQQLEDAGVLSSVCGAGWRPPAWRRRLDVGGFMRRILVGGLSAAAWRVPRAPSRPRPRRACAPGSPGRCGGCAPARSASLALRLGGQALVVLARSRSVRSAMEGVALAGRVGLLGAPGLPAGALAGTGTSDAVDRADRHAQLAAGALVVDHRVHALGRADDAVDRAGLDAQRAADAPGLVDDGQRRGPSWPWPGRAAAPGGRSVRQACDAFGAAGRAAVDGGLAVARWPRHSRGSPGSRSACTASAAAARRCASVGRGIARRIMPLGQAEHAPHFGRRRRPGLAAAAGGRVSCEAMKSRTCG